MSTATSTGTSIGTSSRFRALDGVRAVAITLVFLYHTALGAPPNSMPWLRSLMFQGRAGVWVFFVLSGYLIFRPFARSMLHGTSVAWSGYALRRAVRIYPAYVLALLVLALAYDYGNLRSFADWVQALTLTQNLTGIAYEGQRGIQQAWSLAVEMNFYVFVPIFALAIVRIARRGSRSVERSVWWGIALVVMLGGIWQVAARNTIVPLFLLPNYFPAFGAGMALAVASVRMPSWLAPIALFVGRHRAFVWLAAAGVLAMRGWVFDSPEGFDSKQGPEAQFWFTLFAVPVVAAAVWSLDRPGVLVRRIPVALGTVSYGVFLWHLAMMQGWSPSKFWLAEDLDQNAIARIGVFTPLALGVATASWFLVERPLLRWVHTRREPEAPAATQVR
jgi:peptidoglycan/LPS O-acetylase OafA/YrhL